MHKINFYTSDEFNHAIIEAYKNKGRSKLWLAACLMQEAGELSEHIIKDTGYHKPYKLEDILSEAGDVLNFLTALLHSHDYTLEDAMANNINKLKKRGWIS